MDGTYRIAYDDGDNENKVPRYRIKSQDVDYEEVQPQRLSPGDRCDANFKGTPNFFPGKILRANHVMGSPRKEGEDLPAPASYDVEFDDGDVGEVRNNAVTPPRCAQTASAGPAGCHHAGCCWLKERSRISLLTLCDVCGAGLAQGIDKEDIFVQCVQVATSELPEDARLRGLLKR